MAAVESVPRSTAVVEAVANPGGGVRREKRGAREG